MKKIILVFVCSGFLLHACKEEETCMDGIQNQDETAIDCGGVCELCPITYPHDGLYGENILNASTVIFYLAPDYSLHAVLPEGTSIKIVLQNESGNPATGTWFYSLGSSINLAATSYDDATQSQTFHAAAGAQEIDLSMSFGGNGNATIQVFENEATSPTWTKAISW